MRRKSTAVATTCLAALCAACGQEAEPERPFPFNFEVFLEHLQEPNLRSVCSESTETIRLITIPAFTLAWSVRVENRSGSVLAYESIALVSKPPETSNRRIAESRWSELSELVTATEFWDLESDSDVWVPDGTIVTFEACSFGKYHVIQRQLFHEETKPLVSYFEGLRTSK